MRDIYIWAQQPFLLGPVESVSNLWTWFATLRSQLFDANFLLALVVAWKAWELRNNEIHASPMGASMDIVNWSQTFLQLFQDAQVDSEVCRAATYETNWSPPPADFIKLNVDAAFPPSAEYYRVGVVARDSFRRCVWWGSKEIFERPNPVDGEARVILFALEVARHKLWPQIIVEGDCLQIINILSAGSRSYASFGALLDSCFAFVHFFRSISFKFVKRSGNMLAHELATSVVYSGLEGYVLSPDVCHLI